MVLTVRDSRSKSATAEIDSLEWFENTQPQADVLIKTFRNLISTEMQIQAS